jgi:diacylglycerol kinase family enzyme
LYCWQVWPAFYRLCRQPIDIRLTVDDQSISTTLLSLTIANQPFLGRRFHVSPGADCRDGLAHLFCIEPASILRNIQAVCGAVLPPLPTPANVWRAQGRRIIIENQNVLPFMGDGEMLRKSSRFEVEVVPGALRVITPRPDNSDSTDPSRKEHSVDSVYPLKG